LHAEREPKDASWTTQLTAESTAGRQPKITRIRPRPRAPGPPAPASWRSGADSSWPQHLARAGPAPNPETWKGECDIVRRKRFEKAPWLRAPAARERRSRDARPWSGRLTSSSRERRTEIMRIRPPRYVMIADQCFPAILPVTRERGSLVKRAAAVGPECGSRRSPPHDPAKGERAHYG
jgi:hypothetical protein